MDVDLEKIMAMVDGQNVENFSTKLVTQKDKEAIDEALELIFSGMSLQEWLNNVVLKDAWHMALDKMRDMIFSLYDQKSTIVEYLHYALFEHRKKTFKRLDCSAHSGEYINCTVDKRIEWNKKAQEKIDMGLNILKHVIDTFNPAVNYELQGITFSKQYELQKDREYILKK